MEKIKINADWVREHQSGTIYQLMGILWRSCALLSATRTVAAPGGATISIGIGGKKPISQYDAERYVFDSASQDAMIKVHEIVYNAEMAEFTATAAMMLRNMGIEAKAYYPALALVAGLDPDDSDYMPLDPVRGVGKSVAARAYAKARVLVESNPDRPIENSATAKTFIGFDMSAQQSRAEFARINADGTLEPISGQRVFFDKDTCDEFGLVVTVDEPAQIPMSDGFLFNEDGTPKRLFDKRLFFPPRQQLDKRTAAALLDPKAAPQKPMPIEPNLQPMVMAIRIVLMNWGVRLTWY